MAVQIELASGLKPGNAQAECHHFSAIEGAKHLAADFAGNDKQAEREQFYILKPPDFLLKTHGLGELFEFCQLVNIDISAVCHRCYGVVPQF